MKLAFALLQILTAVSVSSAFSPIAPRAYLSTAARTSTHRYSSQWEDEEDEASAKSRVSFDEAGDSLRDAVDKERMDSMGDYDTNPAYKSESIDRVREAIRQRTESLGIEKSTLSAQAILEAEARAKAGIANGPQGLDLSQISTRGPSSSQDDKPSMFFEPEDEMSDEEMKEADPTGQLTIVEQVKVEWKEATWPTFGAALKEVGLLILIVALTGSLIIGWDSFLRDTYTDLGFIPKPEDIMQGSDNMVLPEGWTNNMSEEDFMKFQDEVGSVSDSAASSAGSTINSVFPEL